MEKSINPISLSADKTSKLLTIRWDAQHLSIYPFGLVRQACPCAQCRGGHENMSSEPDPVVFTIKDFPDVPETRMVGMEGVGAYGVLFEWEDGHRVGIYNWHFLRALCPCPICSAERAAQLEKSN
jgi:DUF971 family protein